MNRDVQSFYHETSGTFTYVVTQNGEAMIIDPLLGIDGNDFVFLLQIAKR